MTDGTFSDTTQPACRLVAAGTTAWLGAGTPRGGCTMQTIEEYTDGGTSAIFFRPVTGYLPPSVVGDAVDGLWTMRPAVPGETWERQVLSVDPETGAESVAATVPGVPIPPSPESTGLIEGQEVFFDGSLYLLEPPFKKDGYLGYTSIVRIRPAPVGSPGSRRSTG